MNPEARGRANIAATLLILAVGAIATIHMRAAFLPPNAALLARVPNGAPMRSEPLAVFGYLVYVIAILLVIALCGPMRRATLLKLGTLAVAVFAAAGLVLAEGRTWPLAAAAGAIAVGAEIVRRSLGETRP